MALESSSLVHLKQDLIEQAWSGIALLCVLLVLVLVSGCHSSSSVPLLLRACGSTSIGTYVMPEMIRLYMRSKGYHQQGKATRSHQRGRAHKSYLFQRKHKGRTLSLRVEIRLSGSRRMLGDLKRGRCDIGMKSDGALPEAAREANSLQAYPLAQEEMVWIVHRQNPVSSLQMKDLRQLCQGKGKGLYWRKGQPVKLAARERGSGTRAFVERQLCASGRGTRRKLRVTHLLKSNKGAIDYVQQERHGLAFVPGRLLTIKHVYAVKVLPIKGKGWLPMRTWYLYKHPWSRYNMQAEALLHFLNSQKTHELLNQYMSRQSRRMKWLKHYKRPAYLRFCGSSSIGSKVMPALVKRYMKGYKRLSQTVLFDPIHHIFTRNDLYKREAKGLGLYHRASFLVTGSRRMHSALRQGHCDIGMRSSGPLPPEKRRELLEYAFAQEKMVWIANQANPISELQATKLKSLCGAPGAWPDGKPIRLATRSSHSGTRAFVERQFCGRKRRFVPTKIAENNAQALDYVKQHPSALSFVPERIIGKDDTEVKVLTIRGRWTPTRTWYLYADPESLRYQEARGFWRFLTVGEVQDQLKRWRLQSLQCLPSQERYQPCRGCRQAYKEVVTQFKARKVPVDILFSAKADRLSGMEKEKLEDALRKYILSPGCRKNWDIWVFAVSAPNTPSRRSKKRAERIKEWLIRRGISARRIRAVPAGIDRGTRQRGTRHRVELWMLPGSA